MAGDFLLPGMAEVDCVLPHPETLFMRIPLSSPRSTPLLPLAATSLALALLAPGCGGSPFDTYVPPQVSDLAKRPLRESEKEILGAKGFVLSTIEPLSFHEGYAALFKAHEPVYFTADAVLHALHSSFDSILADVETHVLARELKTLLDGLREGLSKSASADASIRSDLDLYLAVAKSLLDGKNAAPVAGADAAQIGRIVAAAKAAEGPTEVALFGGSQLQDLSMMKPRGHYTKSAALTQYFQSMMWLGTVDLRIGGKQQGHWQIGRGALQAAALLHELATPAITAAWQKIDKASQVFVGPGDSMSLPGVGRALAKLDAPKTPLASRTDDELGAALAPEATQQIFGTMAHGKDPPLAFLLLGQRFVFDSLVFSETTYERIPAYRMMPSPLDVAAAVFKNPAAEVLLAPDLERYGYRDALHAVAKRGEAFGNDLWEGSVYHGWLRALGRLSPDPARDKGLPPVFRSEPWQRRMLSSQLASWAELRHDTILYAKQSFTSMALCDYPDGYVDPYPEVFAEIEHLAALSTTFMKGLDFGAETHLQSRILLYFQRLGDVASHLRKMAQHERDNAPLDADEVDYLKQAVAIHVSSGGCTLMTTPVGWHAELYFDREEIMKREPVIADVHTQPTDEGGASVGRVLHVGTGHPRQITVTIQTDTGSRIYRGIVGTYHEVITSGFKRLNDQEWRAKLTEGPVEDPAWLSDVVAPSGK